VAARRRSPSAISEPRAHAQRAAGDGSMATIVVSFGSEAATAESTFSSCAGFETTHLRLGVLRMYWLCGAVSVG
jgi:hypothetical protein